MKTVFTVILLLSISSLARASSSLFDSDFKRTFAEAKKERKPILIDFYGIWCPPCNELDETVFESRPFLEKSKAFRLLKVDADAQSSWEIKHRYKVGGYPTIVFTDPDGDELYRVVGYRTPKEFVRVMDFVSSLKSRDLGQACRSKQTEDLWRCAKICQERKDHPCATKAFKKLEAKLDPKSSRYQEVRYYYVENANGDDLKRDGFERLLRDFPANPMALLWATEYLVLFEDRKNVSPKKEILELVLSKYSQMTMDPTREELGITMSDLAQMRADLLEKLGKVSEAKAAWKEAAGLLEKLASELSSSSLPRGFTMERIGCLESAGEVESALKLAHEYRGKFPQEFSFHYQAASILERAKKYSDAVPIARKAYEFSYGDNRIRAATLLLKLYQAVPDIRAAEVIYGEVTQGIRPDTSLEIRTHRYMKKLKVEWEKLKQAKT